jgi:hypothetical protein
MKHKDEILRLGAEGLSYNEIVSQLGCSKGTVSYHLGKGQVAKTNARTNTLRNRVKEYVRQHKEASGCVDCKQMYPYFVLQFDHVGDDKSFNVSKFQNHSVSLESVIAEIEKCEVVCANCHAFRSQKRMNS